MTGPTAATEIETPSELGHILIVDDNRVNRIKLAHAVEQQGHTAETAEDGATALTMVREGDFDVILLDIVMPEMDGFEVLARLKGDPSVREIPVIVISASDEMDSVVRCIELGAEDHLSKPFNPALLRARLATSLAKKRLRDLERAYLQQELALRQNEKLATLGRLSAGLAHELNNPAAGALRAARHLGEVLSHLGSIYRELCETGSPGSLDALKDIEDRLSEPIRSGAHLDAIRRAEIEDEIEEWLDRKDAGRHVDAAACLASAGYGVDEMERAISRFPESMSRKVVDWICATAAVVSLLEEVRAGTARVSEIVGALKTYTFMDRAPVQSIDVREGLDDTLAILRARIDGAAELERIHEPDLPRITAWGSELNQVWTNLLENAVDAVARSGRGRIIVQTAREGNGVRVVIEDNGGGIPESILPRVFDPFFTTKPPGQGVGLGLTLAHAIIVQKHGGEISAASDDGWTRIVVTLPGDAGSGQPTDTGD